MGIKLAFSTQFEHEHVQSSVEEKETTKTELNNELNNSCSRIGRYVAVFVSSTLIILTLASQSRTSRVNDSTNIVFVHFLSFAAHIGAQFWVTFVAGFVMFFSLPRIMFGHLQSRLFPSYFVTTLVLSSVTLWTFIERHPFVTMTPSEIKQCLVLSVCVISTFLNCSCFAPGIVDSMIRVFEMEKASGVAYVVGYCKRTELKKDLQYREFYKAFRLYHSISGIANVITLICNIIYLYQSVSLGKTFSMHNEYCLL